MKVTMKANCLEVQEGQGMRPQVPSSRLVPHSRRMHPVAQEGPIEQAATEPIQDPAEHRWQI